MLLDLTFTACFITILVLVAVGGYYYGKAEGYEEARRGRGR